MKRRVWKLDGKPVSASAVREFVFQRDKGCMAARYEHASGIPPEEWHVCGSPFGFNLTLEHVTRVHGELDGRKDDERHTVALCLNLNGGTTTLAPKAMKNFFRERLRNLYPSCVG